MNKDFERCCSFLADMIIKYAPEIKEEVEVCMMIKDSIDDEKVRIQYNAQCKKCVHDCKQSFRCRIVWCGKYCSKRRKRS